MSRSTEGVSRERSLNSRLLTLEAIVCGHLMHHVLVAFVLQAICASWVEEVVRDAITGICVQCHEGIVGLSA